MNKAALLSGATPTEPVELPGIGTITVRGMTRGELATAGKGNDPDLTERRVLAMCLVDPQLTEEEAGQWQNTAPAGLILDVVAVINRLSGLAGRAERAEKEAYKSLRSGPSD